MSESGTISKKSRIRFAFTLIELLVVMAIISMLLSISLPALNAGREAGKRIHCMTNNRGLALAWMLYAQDNDDRLCRPETFNDPSAGYWVKDGIDYLDNTLNAQLNPDAGTERALKKGSLWSYLQTVKIYKCRSDSSQLLRSYSISAAMGGTIPVNLGSAYKTITEVSTPSDSIVFIDAASPGLWISGAFLPITASAADANSFIWDSFTSQRLSTRHDNGCNMSFADGHCEYFKYRDYRTSDFASGILPSAQAASVDNPDITKLMKLLKGK